MELPIVLSYAPSVTLSFTNTVIAAHLEEDDEGVGLREGEEEEREESGDAAVEDGRAHLLQSVGRPLLARACNQGTR